ncbi:uncharacterized protein LOC143826752 [Paroedura picta]|uniref:uncharacterized protein LOC143826752 n=1 Tax=Paroedura picta TaxID=143630 RepID=UPI0040571023
MMRIWEKAGKPPLEMRRYMATQSPAKLSEATASKEGEEQEEEEEEGPSTSSKAAADTMRARMRSMEARLASLEGLLERQRMEWQAAVADLRGELESKRQLMQQKEEEELKKKEEAKEEEDLWRRKVRGTMTRFGKQLREMTEGGGKSPSEPAAWKTEGKKSKGEWGGETKDKEDVLQEALAHVG